MQTKPNQKASKQTFSAANASCAKHVAKLPPYYVMAINPARPNASQLVHERHAKVAEQAGLNVQYGDNVSEDGRYTFLG